MMFLFQILSRPVYVVPACMLRGSFLWVLFTLKHTIYTPLLLRIKIILVKFLLKITSLKIQSDCFGINIKALSKAPNRL